MNQLQTVCQPALMLAGPVWRAWRLLLLVAAYLLAPQAWAQAPSAHAVSAATQSLLLSDRALFLVDASAALTVTEVAALAQSGGCLLYTSPSPRD